MKTESKVKKLQKSLTHNWSNAWDKLDDKELEKTLAVSESYKSFLDIGKTEREANDEIIRIAEENGFKPLNYFIESNKSPEQGTKIYANNKGKGVALFVFGKEKLEVGMNIIGSHLDAPRIDLKQFPLYEDSELALLKTHYCL
ncbi:MAG: aminopeptidase, partial [Dethiosulfatibacter sp.]|nr:aminopeptidase [Dethiosulfatibacter sp.]